MTARGRPARILEITSYPPPHAGWGVRVRHVRARLLAMGHECVVLNIGKSRKISSPHYVDVQNGIDYCWKVLRFSHQGYTVHAHVNGDSPKGLALTLVAQLINACCGRRCFLTFHAGPVQRYFPSSQSFWFGPAFWLAFRLPRTIICNSDAVKAQIVSYGIDARKIVPIPAFSTQYLHFERVALDERLERFFTRWDPVVCSYVFFRTEFFIESLVDAVALLTRRFPRLGLVIMGSDSGSDPIVRRLAAQGLEDRVLLAGDLSHDAFLTVLERARLYIRTPSKDGVCSSVLEAMSLRVPVVAAENGTRPPGVVTFTANDPQDLAVKVEAVLVHYDHIRRALVVPPVRDTVTDEANLLAGVVDTEDRAA